VKRLTIDPDALRIACDDFGLTLPPRIAEVSKSTIHAYGIYDGIDCLGPAHMIRLAYDCPDPNAVLWHELCHAQQCERIGDWHRFNTLYHEQVKEVTERVKTAPNDVWYAAKMECPFELEARAYGAAAAAGHFPILILFAEPAKLPESTRTKWRNIWSDFRS
jgi:hypothetical protein